MAVRRLPLCFLYFVLAFQFLGADGGKTLKMDVRNRPPDLNIDDQGRCSGPLIDIIELAASRLGYRVVFQERQFDGSLVILHGGGIDLVPRVGWTEDRAKLIDFLGPIGYEDKEILFLVKKGKEDSIRSYEDLATLRIGVKKGSTYFDRFDKDDALDKVASLDDDNMVRMFEAGRFDVMITIDRIALEVALKKADCHDYAFARYRCMNSLGVYYGIAPNHPLKAALQRILEGMVRSGEIAAIYRKYGMEALHPEK